MTTGNNLAAAKASWEAQVESKWKEIRQTNRSGGKPFISIFSPQWTMQVDKDQRYQTRQDLMQWSVEHYREWGIEVKCVPDEENIDGFAVVPVSDE